MLKRPKSFLETLLDSIFLATILLASPVLAQHQAAEHPPSPAGNGVKSPVVDSGTAMRMLLEGNRRFIKSQPLHPHESAQRRVELGLTGQHPFAIILSCADSRVPPENVFDAGLGDLFVVRVAGHIVDDAVIGSIEYASQHLGAKLLVVLGHEKCGAVQAAIANQREAHLRYLVDAIQPAVLKVRTRTPATTAAGFADRVVWANVIETMSALETSEPILRKMVARQELKIAGAVYHIATGKVEFLR